MPCIQGHLSFSLYPYYLVLEAQVCRAEGLLTDIGARQQVLNTSLKWLCQQTAATPNPGDYIQGEYRSIKPRGHQRTPCSNTSSFFLNSRASLTLLTQPIHGASMSPHTILPGLCVCRGLVWIFQIQPLSTTEAANSTVPWEVVWYNFKDIPGSSVVK